MKSAECELYDIPISLQPSVNPSAILALSSKDPTIRLLDATGGTLREYDQSKTTFTKALISPVLQSILCLSESKSLITVFQLNKDKPDFKCTSPEKLECMTLAEDCSLLFAGSILGNVFVYNLRTGQLRLRFQVARKSLRFIETSPCNQYLLIGCDDFKIYLFDLPGIVKLTLARGREQTSQTNLEKDYVNSQFETKLGEYLANIDRELEISEQRKQNMSNFQINKMKKELISLPLDSGIETNPNSFLKGIFLKKICITKRIIEYSDILISSYLFR